MFAVAPCRSRPRSPMRQSLIPMATLLALCASEARPDGDSSAPATLVRGLVAASARVEVPAQSAGQLVTLEAREGMQVQRGLLLAAVDDFRPQRDRQAAAARQQIAGLQAANDVDQRFWQAAIKLAETDYVRAVQSNKKLPGAVPQAEERRRFLSLRQCQLELEKVARDRKLAVLSEQAKAAETGLADVKLRQHRIESPCDGVVVEIRRHRGEWVEPGDTVIRIVSLATLRVEFLLNAADYSPHEVVGRTIVATAFLPHERHELFAGRVVFVNPRMEPSGEFLVWAEVENRLGRTHWLLRPGMEADVQLEMPRSRQPPQMAKVKASGPR